MKTKLLKLSEIVTTAGTQIRARIDTDKVDEYATAMQDASNKFPPVVVYHDGSQFILADGFHRVMAASRNGFKDIEADVRKGTRADALKFALGANSAHGLPRTNADKRRSVELALAEWPKLSDREIARICAVAASFVGDVRKANCSRTTVEQPAPRLGADGKERRMPARKSTPAVNQSAAQETGGADEVEHTSQHRPERQENRLPCPPVERPVHRYGAQVEDSRDCLAILCAEARRDGTKEQIASLLEQLRLYQTYLSTIIERTEERLAQIAKE